MSSSFLSISTIFAANLLSLIFAKNKYLHLFFDLDRTIWDFDRNSLETFRDIFLKFDLKSKGIPGLEEFRTVFKEHNDMLWSYYRKGEIKKEVLSVRRFEMTLNSFGIDDLLLAAMIADDYLTIRHDRIFLFPHAHETLEYLHHKYDLHIITNGFEEVQFAKLSMAGLGCYFRTVTTSEEAGVKKPDPFIFELAMHKAGALYHNSIMIGDDVEVDILGARNAGMDQIHFNYHKEENHAGANLEIEDLKELTKFF